MMFKSAIVATLMASATAFAPAEGIDASSKAGNKLMSKARALEQNGEADTTWMVNYSIKYLGCTSLIQVRGEGGEGNGEDGDSLLYTQNLVKFGLCPNDASCASCGNGSAQYVVPMNDFVDAWTEAKMTEQQQACENVRENCYCENANDDEVCEAQCYTQMGMDFCIQYGDDEEFEVQRFMECEAMEGANGNDNNNNNNNNNANYNANNNYYNGIDMYANYWSGLSCASNGYDINLAIFQDSGCTQKAKSGTYEAFNYGATLPYEKESLITAKACMSCVEVDEDGNNDNNNNNGNNNNNNGNNYNYEVAEICEMSYQSAAKCETNFNTGSAYFTPDTSGCDYIKNILPRLAKAASKVSGRSSASSGTASVAFAVIFFLTSCVLGAYSFFLYRKIHRAKVNLAQSEGMMMA